MTLCDTLPGKIWTNICSHQTETIADYKKNTSQV